MADVLSTLAGWSSTTGSNLPSGTTSVSTNLDDNLREIQGVIVRGLSHKGSDIASSTTPALGATEGLMHDITGTATITGFDTVRAGIWKVLKFEGAATITHNATNLILPGGSNITTADGDIAIFISEGSGNWRCLAYVPASGSFPFVDSNAIVIGSSDRTKKLRVEVDGLTTATTRVLTMRDADFDLGAATQAEQETGTSVVASVTPGRQHFHKSACKAWGTVTGAGVLSEGYNCSTARNGTGDYTVTFSIAMSTATYAIVITGTNVGGTGNTLFGTGTKLAGSCQILSTGGSFAVLADASFHFVVFGDI